MNNRLNDLDSKSYMKFLKSWALFNETTLHDFILFFSKAKDESGQHTSIGLWGFDEDEKMALSKAGRKVIDLRFNFRDKLNYVLIDLRKEVFRNSEEVDIIHKKYLQSLLIKLSGYLREKAYITLLCSNYEQDNVFFPSAWQIAKTVSRYFEMKDEKLLCATAVESGSSFFPVAGNNVIFALNFRHTQKINKTDRSVYLPTHFLSPPGIKRWFVLKPPPRQEKLKLHPAKFPEVLIEEFIKCYSSEGDNIFDPMAGTGSTQIAALSLNRNTFGCEITGHFQRIAMERILNCSPTQDYYIAHDDAWNFDTHHQFPALFDYIVTSPPYWDMLNMDGAATQKTRILKGLRTNYSDLDTDLGNCPEYNIFLVRLIKIYTKILSRLKPGGFFTIIIKNIKKKGTIYTFAWDLVEKLNLDIRLAAVNYWLQDDIRIAPYGYGNAWVSNTFHQYCLTFKKG